MRHVAAVRARHDIAAEAGRTFRPGMTTGTAINKASTERERRVDVADAVARQWADALAAQKFALEELSPAPDRAKGIAGDDEGRRVGRQHVAAARADLVGQRLGDT